MAFLQKGRKKTKPPYNKNNNNQPDTPAIPKKPEKPVATPDAPPEKSDGGCFHCGAEDHWVSQCPNLSNEKRQQLRAQVAEMDDEDEAEEDEDYDGVAFLETSSRKRQTLNPNYAYLDQVIIKHHVTDVRESKRLLRGQCNVGTSTISKVGNLGQVEMWYNPEGITNILSLPRLEQHGYRVQYDTLTKWEVTTPTGETIMFK